MEPGGLSGVKHHVEVVPDELVLRASLDDPAAFEELFDRYHGRIWAFLARSAGRSEADDLAGDVFVAAYASRDRFDPERGSVRSWLYAIAANRLRSRYRTVRRADRAFARAVAELVPEAATTDAVDDALDGTARLARTLAAMAALAPADREVLVLAAWEELDYAEIAEVLGVALGTVRSRLSRARGRLRELVERCGEEVHDG